MHIEDLTNELNAVFALSAEEIKSHIAVLESLVAQYERAYAHTEKRVRARIKRGIAKKLASKEELSILRRDPARIAELKLLIRAIKEGMAYRSMA
jgi:hypothetical protein